MYKSLRPLLCACLFVSMFATADAELVRVELSGQISEVSDTDGLLTTLVAEGDIVTGTWYYDTSMEDQDTGDPNSGFYSQELSSLPFFVLTIDSESLAPNTSESVFLNVSNDVEYRGVMMDRVRLSYDLDSSGLATTVLAYYAEIELEDHSHTAISSAAVPPSLNRSDWPDLQQFSLVLDSLDAQGGFVKSIATGTLSSLTTSVVPEPSSVWLLLLGMASISLLALANRSRLTQRQNASGVGC